MIVVHLVPSVSCKSTLMWKMFIVVVKDSLKMVVYHKKSNVNLHVLWIKCSLNYGLLFTLDFYMYV